jgi:hypothetical protein
MISRRNLLFGAAFSSCGCCLALDSSEAWPGSSCRDSAELQSNGSSAGCLLAEDKREDVLSKIKFSLLDKDIRTIAIFARIQSIMEHLYEVKPDFEFYDDSDGPNAYATPERVTGGCDTSGAVIFGENLLLSEKNTSDMWGSAITLIMGHEYGHISQYKIGSIFAAAVQKELHADYLGGWALG